MLQELSKDDFETEALSLKEEVVEAIFKDPRFSRFAFLLDMSVDEGEQSFFPLMKQAFRTTQKSIGSRPAFLIMSEAADTTTSFNTGVLEYTNAPKRSQNLK